MDDSETPSTPPNPTTESPSNPLLRASNPLVTDLEQEVLDEYSRLLGNVNKVCLYFPSFSLSIFPLNETQANNYGK